MIDEGNENDILSEEKNTGTLENANTEENGSENRSISPKAIEQGAQKPSGIEIVDERIAKPFLGGFRHAHSGKEYHNASAQTNSKVCKKSHVEQFSRDTQTVTTKAERQQTTHDTSTQMTKVGCYVSNVGERVIIPGKYETADERMEKLTKKVIFLQSHWRRWLALQYVNHLREDRDRRLEWEKQEQLRKEQERLRRMEDELKRRLNPKTKEDFDLLFAALEKWRLEETDLIMRMHDEPEQKAALVNLLEQESYLISSIGQQRAIAGRENTKRNDQRLLEKAGTSKKLRSFDGKTTYVETPHTAHAAKLKELYNSLQHKYLTNDERMDVLASLRNTVQDNKCQLTQEILELVDRESTLMLRNVKDDKLEGLRKRIQTLFLRYCKTPLFNPEIGRLTKIPQDSNSLRRDIYFCPSCNSYLRSADFPLQSKSRVIGRCKACSTLENESRLRQDISKFHNMLRTLRQDEEDKGNGSIAFLIQDRDIQYLVEQIWCSQSALSASADVHDLMLAKWDLHQAWSPWNCVLLTKEEAAAHNKLDNIHQAYGRIFIAKVHNRHVIAKGYFKNLLPKSAKMKGNNTGVFTNGQ